MAIFEKTKQEKYKKQIVAGKIMEVKCYKNGRCPLCTLHPPCNHIAESVLPSIIRG